MTSMVQIPLWAILALIGMLSMGSGVNAVLERMEADKKKVPYWLTFVAFALNGLSANWDRVTNLSRGSINYQAPAPVPEERQP